MLAARISPKAQYGLRLLAKLQGRSIAESLEWTINLGLRQTTVGPGVEEARLMDVVDLVWQAETEAQRLLVLHNRAPELMDFDHRSIWQLIKRCDDLWIMHPYVQEDDINGVPMLRPAEPGETPNNFIPAPNYPLMDEHWEKIKATGIALGHAGEVTDRYTLEEIVNGDALARAGLS